MMKQRSYFFGLISGVAIVLLTNYIFVNYISAEFKGMSSIGDNSGSYADIDDKLADIKKYIDTYYVRDYEEEKLLEKVEDAIYTTYVDSLEDVYTTYMNKEAYDSFNTSSDGNYVGIGIMASTAKDDGTVLVNTVFEGSPAEAAGIKAGDKIIGVEGVEEFPKDLQDAVALIKGEEGTEVTVNIYRTSEREYLNITVERRAVEIPSVSAKMLEDNVGYIHILSFDGVTTHQFIDKYEELKNQNMERLIVDVRNNPGGRLDVVVDIASYLIDEGTVLTVEDKKGKKAVYETNRKIEKLDIPFVMLINEFSASASEVLAGAVQDTKSGVIIGKQSYGKGVVQKIFGLQDGSALKITVSRYFTPNGVCIDGVGLTPDYEVEMDEILTYQIQNLEFEEDVQLQKAFELVKEK